MDLQMTTARLFRPTPWAPIPQQRSARETYRQNREQFDGNRQSVGRGPLRPVVG